MDEVTFDLMPNAIKEAVAVLELFRRLGFSSDDIFVNIDEDAYHTPSLFVQLHTQEQELNFRAGPWSLGPEALMTWWKLILTVVVRPGAKKELDQIFKKSATLKNVKVVLSYLRDNGIKIPKEDAILN